MLHNFSELVSIHKGLGHIFESGGAYFRAIKQIKCFIFLLLVTMCTTVWVSKFLDKDWRGTSMACKKMDFLVVYDVK